MDIKNKKNIMNASVAIGIALIMIMPGITLGTTNKNETLVRAGKLPTNYKMRVENSSASIGQVGHTFHISGTWITPINEYAIQLNFNPDDIEVTNVTLDGCIGTALDYLTTDIGSDYVGADLFSSSGFPPGTGDLFNIVVNIKSSATQGHSDLILDPNYSCFLYNNYNLYPDLFNGYIDILGNRPPGQPNQPQGQTNGHIETLYTYVTNPVTDPDGDTVTYLFNWSDGTDSGWLTQPSASHMWNTPGIYEVTVKAKDEHGLQTDWSQPLSVTISNHAPTTPTRPSGITNGHPGGLYTYTTNAVTDPDGDQVFYLFDWDDGTNSSWLVQPSASHSWTAERTYAVRVKAKDEHGLQTEWSQALNVMIFNNPPGTPSQPQGPTSGDVDGMYTYSTQAVDQDGNQVQYRFDWGDHQYSEWTSFAASGQPVSLSYFWVYPGVYAVKAQARDQGGKTSEWSSALMVTISGNDRWNMFHHDPLHSGFSSSPAPNLYLQWCSPTSGLTYSSPAYANGKIYVASDGRGVSCLDAAVGHFIWNFSINAVFRSSPTVVGGRVYIGSYGSNVYCLDAADGHLIWNYVTYNAISSSPVVVNNRVYIGNDDGKVYCLNATDGHVEWIYTTGVYQTISSSPAVAFGKVFIGGSVSGKVYCLDASNGTKLWDRTAGSFAYSSPAVVNGRVYIGSDNHKMYCLNAMNGSFIWNFTTGESIHSSPAVVNGRVYIGSDDNKIYCLNAMDGSFIWNYTTGSIIHSSPAIAGDKLYIGSGCTLYCLNSTDGTYISSSILANQMDINSPAIVDGFLYITTFTSTYCFGGNNQLPAIPNNPAPANGETNVSVNADLSWTGGDPDTNDTVTYTVYFGTSSTPPWVVSNLPATIYDPGTMKYNTTYYWKIVAMDNHGASTEGPIWHFTTQEAPNNPPNIPNNPTPANGATNIDVYTDLSWTGGDPDAGDKVTYDIYFGTSPSPPIVAYSQLVPSYDPGVLTYSTTYYWKIVAWDDHNASSSGPVWNFTTQQKPVTLNISSITGIFGVKAVITNNGAADATNVTWNIKLDGGIILFGKNITHKIDKISAGDTAAIRAFVFGFGKTTITVTATCNEGSEATRAASGFVFLVFVLGVK